MPKWNADRKKYITVINILNHFAVLIIFQAKWIPYWIGRRIDGEGRLE
jgi:hypothetical protein